MSDLPQRVFDDLNAFLVGRPGCPGRGSRGECAMVEDWAEGYLADCSWWPELPLPVAELAEVVRSAGGDEICIELTLWDDFNDIKGGRDCGGCYAFTVKFKARATAVAREVVA